MPQDHVHLPINKRVQSLDGFRAFSICIVIVAHLTMAQALPEPMNAALGFVINGSTGVQFFFVISGFLISYYLIREKETTGKIDFGKFYTRRALRIMPAFYVFLCSLLIINWLGNLDIPPSAFLSAALYIHNFAPWETSWYLNHTWSLSVEEQFYLMWPALFLFLFRYGKLWHWIASLALSSLARSLFYKFPAESKFFMVDFLMYSDYLFSGCFMAFLYSYKRDLIIWLVNHRFAPWAMYLGIVFIVFLPSAQYHPKFDVILVPIAGTIINLSIAFQLLYFMHRDQSIGYWLLNSRPAIFVGKLSYSLYLWQQFFISPGAPWNLIFLFLTATCSYFFIELPFLRLKDKFQTVTHE